MFKVIEIRQKKKKLRNSEELVEEWKNVCLEEEEILFSIDVEKMFTKLKREEIEKRVKMLIEEK